MLVELGREVGLGREGGGGTVAVETEGDYGEDELDDAEGEVEVQHFWRCVLAMSWLFCVDGDEVGLLVSYLLFATLR